MNKVIIKLIVILLPISLFAQERNYTISGTVYDSETKRAISQAQVQLQYSSIFTSTNDNGEFSLLLNANQAQGILVVSSTAYASQSIMLDGEEEFISIMLKPFFFKLNEVKVKSPIHNEDAKSLVEKAMKNIKKLTPSYKARAEYQHRMKENGNLVKLTEGQILVTDPVGFGKNKSEVSLSESIEFIEKRESLDHSFNRMGFKRSYYDTYFENFAFLLKNGLKYERKGVAYLYFFEDSVRTKNYIDYTITGFDKSKIDSISFQEFFDLTFVIRQYDHEKALKILSFQMDYESTLTKKYLSHREKSHFLIVLKETNQRLAPKRMEHMLTQKTNHGDGGEDINMQAFHSIEFKEVSFDKEKLSTELIKSDKYNPTYWQEKPLSIDTYKALSVYLDLSKQFKLQHNKEERNELQEQIDLAKIQKYIVSKKFRNDVRIIFWEDYKTLSAYHYLPDKRSSNDAPILFIGKFTDYRDWLFVINGGNYMYYPHFNLPKHYEELLPNKEMEKKLPIYLYYLKGGDLIFSAAPFID
jgi:hypothetical protein